MIRTKQQYKACYRKQSGTILIIALIIVAIIVGIAARFTSSFQLTIARVEQGLVSRQLQQFLLSTESFASWVLIEDANEDNDNEANSVSNYDHLGENWTTELQAPIEQAVIVGTLKDASGLFNLNQLQDKLGGAVYKVGGLFEERFTAPQRRFVRLLQTHPDEIVDADEAKQITEAVMDWLDTDDTVTGAGGAEEAYYQSLDTPYRPANRLFANKTELRLVKGMTKELYHYLSPLIVALPDKDQGINVNTAPIEIIRTIHQNDADQPLSAEDANNLIEARPVAANVSLESSDEPVSVTANQAGEAYEDVNDFTNSAAADSVFGPDATDKPDTFGLRTGSEYFLLTAAVKLLDYERSQVSLIKRESTSQGVTTKVIQRTRSVF